MEKPKLLIIDDDAALCESLIDIFELEGILVDTSNSAEDGTKKAESGFYNIILLDMKLPDADGIKVLEKIKEISPDTEVIIFTAYAKMDTVIKAMDRNAFSFLPKPFETPYMLTIIKRALEKQNIIFENRILYQQTIEEEREWEDTFDSISDLISIHDKDLSIIRCNKAVTEKLNLDYRDIIGKKCHVVFHGSNEPWPTCPFLRCKESLKSESEEEECLGGTFMMSCFPRLDEAGRFNGVVHIARDITERKQVEHAMNTLVVTAAENEGEKFFEQTVISLYDWLDVDCVILSQLIDENSQTTLAMKMDGKLVKNYSYELQGSPYGDVSKKGFCHYPEGVIDLFPDDVEFVQRKVEGYVGISLKDKSGDCIGTICALSRHRLELPPGAENVFNIISARAAVEIERITAEKRVTSLASVLEDSLNEIYIYKADTLKFLQANKGARMNLGYSIDTLRKLTPLHIKPRFTQESFEKLLEPLRSGEKEFIIFETVHQRRDGSLYNVEVHVQLTTFESVSAFLAITLDTTKRKESERALKQIEWLLTKKTPVSQITMHNQDYGDLTELNTSRLIMDSVGKEILADIVSDYLDLLDTSATIYEKDGSYALGFFNSGWCKDLDLSSRSQCGDSDNESALKSGKSDCHESCWARASKVSMEKGEPVEIECFGGINLYAVPIIARGEIVGSINFGYGDPPKNPEKLKGISELYSTDQDQLAAQANAYKTRPPYIIELAKRRLVSSARLIGEIVERKQAENELVTSQERYRSIIDDVVDSLNVGILILDNEYKVIWINKTIEDFFGIKLAEVVGKDNKQLIEEKINLIFEEPDMFKKTVINTYKDNTYVENFTCHVLPGDGLDERWLEHWSQPISSGLYEGGRVEHYTDITAIKKVENDLQDSDQKFRAIFDNTFQFIGLLEPDGTLIESNKGSLEFANIKYSDVINKPYWETPWWSHSVPLQKLLQKSIKHASQDNFVRFDATHIKQDGSLAYVDISLTPVKDKDGNVIFIIPEGRDITELKIVEETVHKLSQAIQQSNVIVVITDLEGNIEYINPRFCKSTGYEYNEVIGQNPRMLKSGETSDENYRELWKTITSGNEWKGEFHNKKKSGELYWENASISPIRDAEGNIINFLGIKEDITDKKRAEQALLFSEERFRAISSTASDAIIMSDNDGIISYWNHAAEITFGYSADEAMGRKLYEICIPEKYHAAYMKGFDKFKDSGQGDLIGKTTEAEAIRKDGTEFPVEISISSVKLNNKWCAIAIIRDISERLKSEEQLRISYKMASLGRLTAGVFHEVLNPVNIISSHIQLLLMDAEEGSRTEEDLKSVQEEIKRIVKISDSLLRFSRKGGTGFEEIEMNNLLESTISLLEPDMKLEEVVFFRKFDECLQHITASKDQLRQVFLNLFTNARDAMPGGGTITVSTKNITGGETPFVRVKVSDTGCGIEKSKMHKIFDPFFTTKIEGKGTGLGLSTSYGIIEDHGGAMSAESEVGKGTTFIIDLPI